ncbi:MAG: hypothetical protein RLZZ297_2029 [Chloroflexota bacterium]|jgi:hypothetical protein
MLRRALYTIHADKRWWRAIGLGGLFSMTLFGHPLAAGLVVEHMENTRKGFPTPLPPLFDWTTRWLMGLFAVLVDFVFFVMPVMAMGMLFFCGGLTLLMARVEDSSFGVLGLLAAILLGWWLFVFLTGASAVGRLVYLDDGGPERALTMYPMREALRRKAWRYYAKARLQSLPLYLIPVLLALAIPWLLQRDNVYGIVGAVVVLWLLLSSVVYANVATMIIYTEVNNELQMSEHARPVRG